MEVVLAASETGMVVVEFEFVTRLSPSIVLKLSLVTHHLELSLSSYLDPGIILRALLTFKYVKTRLALPCVHDGGHGDETSRFKISDIPITGYSRCFKLTFGCRAYGTTGRACVKRYKDSKGVDSNGLVCSIGFSLRYLRLIAYRPPDSIPLQYYSEHSFFRSSTISQFVVSSTEPCGAPRNSFELFPWTSRTISCEHAPSVSC